MLEGIQVLCHSSIVIQRDKKIYIDPFKIDKKYNDADVIFITHSHYDHFSPEDIEKVIKEDTVIVATNDLEEKLKQMNFFNDNIVLVRPDNKYNVLGVKVETIPSYNINKKFHPKSNEWVGYILKIDNITYYIPGDTDITNENRKVKCDVAFVPVRRNIYYGF